MITEMQKRREELDRIIEICGLDNAEATVLRNQLESFSCLAVSVTFRLIMRADNGLSSYWRKRAENAEAAHLGGSVN